MSDSNKKDHPKTLQEAVERLLEELPQEDKDRLRSMDDEDRALQHFGLGMYIRNSMGLHEEGSELLMDCCPDEYKQGGFVYGFDPDQCSSIIIDALCKRLREDDT